LPVQFLAKKYYQVAAGQLSVFGVDVEDSEELQAVFSVFSETLLTSLSGEAEAELQHGVLLYPSAYQPPPFN